MAPRSLTWSHEVLLGHVPHFSVPSIYPYVCFLATVNMVKFDFIFSHHLCRCQVPKPLSVIHQKILSVSSFTTSNCFRIHQPGPEKRGYKYGHKLLDTLQYKTARIFHLQETQIQKALLQSDTINIYLCIEQQQSVVPLGVVLAVYGFTNSISSESLPAFSGIARMQNAVPQCNSRFESTHRQTCLKRRARNGRNLPSMINPRLETRDTNILYKLN